MLFHRSFVMGLVVFGSLALPGAATRALARGGDGGRGSKLAPGDEAQMRDLLSKLAAASGQPEKEERTEADLMYDAMIRWNGEPPGSAAIERLLESSKKEATKTKKATVEKVRKMFWKDPFSDHPSKLIPVRQEDRELLDAYERKGHRRGEMRQARGESRESELARLRAEIDAARAEAAEAQAENARLRRRAETMSERRECVADSDDRADVRLRRRSSSGSGGSHRSRHEARQVALVPAAQTEQRQTPVAPPPTEPIIPATTIAPHNPGMVITPLPVTPPPEAPPLENGRRSRSSRPGR
jgi:hypothetical protein